MTSDEKSFEHKPVLLDESIEALAIDPAGIYVDGGNNIVIEDNEVYECDLGIEIGAASPDDYSELVLGLPRIGTGPTSQRYMKGGLKPIEEVAAGRRCEQAGRFARTDSKTAGLLETITTNCRGIWDFRLWTPD